MPNQRLEVGAVVSDDTINAGAELLARMIADGYATPPLSASEREYRALVEAEWEAGYEQAVVEVLSELDPGERARLRLKFRGWDEAWRKSKAVRP